MDKQLKRSYEIIQRVSTRASNGDDIVFDKVYAIEGKDRREEPELLMRYVKNGNTVHRPPSFDEFDMIKAIINLYNSDIISDEAKKLLKEGVK
jgi:hypothetical protein